MRNTWLGTTALLFLSLTQARWASAQTTPGAQPAEPPARTGSPSAETQVDVSRLPINLDRIQRQLRQSTVRDESDGLQLRYVVDVFGQAPRIELFGNRDYSLTGPAPYGAPTHRDLLQVITPQEYRAPAADFGNLFRWLADKARD